MSLTLTISPTKRSTFANEVSFDCNQRAEECCRLAKELEERGDYEAAQAALYDFWPQIEERPILQGLSTSASGEILLRAGALLGWLGSARQIKNFKQKAHNLLGSSITLFDSLGDETKIAEAHIEEAWCYWREGDFNESRKALHYALEMIPSDAVELRSVAMLRYAEVERAAHNLDKALSVLHELRPVVNATINNST